MKNNRHIWEGWTVQDFIDDLTPTFELRIANAGFMGAGDAFVTPQQLKDWCKSEQPYYKKHIPEVYNHFKNKLGWK